MVNGTQEQPRERRDHAFWDTHFRQRGYKRPGQQQQQRHHRPGLHHGSGGHSSQNNGLNPNNSNPGKAVSSPAHHPRPFDHIENERQHLQYLLAEQDRRAVDLFSRVAAVDGAYDFGSAREQRQARKDRAWVQRRIGQTVDREREILVRLGEIHVEIQCRERWHMVEQQKAFLRQQGGRHRHWGWGGEGNSLNQPPRQGRGSGASHRYYQDEVEPVIVSSYVQQQHQQHQQHMWPTNPRYTSITGMPWTGVTEWYPDFVTSASVDSSRRRTSGAQVGGQVRLLEESPAYRPRRSSYISNASYATEVDERHGLSFDPVLPISRLPDRRRSLPTMHYNWDGGSGHRCLGYIAEE
ncbi:hypothetical protein PG988_004097 [Apiospora saccharicola]